MKRLAPLLAGALLSAGCAWRIDPPAAPRDPVHVYLTAYALHSRVALPKQDDQGSMIEYGFGDWDYYALGAKGPWSGFRALFFSRAAAMARRELPYNEDPESFSLLAGGERSVRLVVERERAATLRDSLEGLWRALGAARSDSAFHPGSGVELRPTDDRYHLFRNSNHRSAGWLRELGCEVRGPAILNRFRVSQPE